MSPSAQNIDFLRQYLRLYPKLTIELFQAISITNLDGRAMFKRVKSNYLNFFTFFFHNIVTFSWKRRDILTLFHCPKSGNEQAPFDYLFSLMGHIFRQCISYKRFSLDPLSDKKVNQNIQLPFELLRIILNFFSIDYAQFLDQSDNYPADISNMVADMKPLIIRIFWEGEDNNAYSSGGEKMMKKPDYVSRVMKFYTSYLVKALKLGILEMAALMMTVYSELSESIRICAGNTRPYLELYSSRVNIGEILYNIMEKEIKDNGECLNYRWINIEQVLMMLKPYSWLQAQFCLTILSRRYIGSLNQHFPKTKKGKYRLSLRLILYIFLAGDIDGFKYDMEEFLDIRARRKKKNNNNNDAEEDRRKNKEKNQMDIEIKVNSRLGLGSLYILIF